LDFWFEKKPSGTLVCRVFDEGQNEEQIFRLKKAVPGTNPTTVSYNASAVTIYNATSSLARFESKSVLLYFEKTL
jgi:hypothetical protein